MLHRFALVLAAITLAACQTAPTAPSPGSEIATATMKRPNLVVSDIERSIALYEGLLGFESGPVSESSSDSFSYPVFKIPRDAKIRFVVMNDTQDNRAFALTEVTGMDLPKLPQRPLMSAYVIGVDDLNGIIAEIQAKGLWTSESKIAEGTEFTFIEQAFTDYDGHLIVLYEILSQPNT